MLIIAGHELSRTSGTPHAGSWRRWCAGEAWPAVGGWRSAGGADSRDSAGAEGVDEPPMVVAHQRGVVPGEGHDPVVELPAAVTDGFDDGVLGLEIDQRGV